MSSEAKIMAKKPTPDTLIKSIHRNVAPTWYGIVLAKHMQDPSITSELKALIAVVATFPRENWSWRGDHLRSLLNWGRERYQKVMREAKARRFVIVNQTSDGLTFHSGIGGISKNLHVYRGRETRSPENPPGGKPGHITM